MITASPEGQHYEYSTRSVFFYHRTEYCEVGDIGHYAAMIISCLRPAVRQYKILFFLTGLLTGNLRVVSQLRPPVPKEFSIHRIIAIRVGAGCPAAPGTGVQGRQNGAEM